MKKFGIVLIVFAIIIIVAQLAILNYDNLGWSKNSGSYLSILSMIFIIGAGIKSFRDNRDH